METLSYNTQRPKLVIPEYGRHVHLMIEQVMAIPEREKRNNMAKAIIGVMGNLNPHLRDVPDFQHKLWDQLFIMSNFELDVDSPFENLKKNFWKQALDHSHIRSPTPNIDFMEIISNA